MNSAIVGALRTGSRRLPEILAVLAGLALIVRVTFRDRIPGVSTVYYATPLPSIALVLVGAGLASVALRRPRWAAAAAVASLALVLTFLGTTYRSESSLRGGEIRGALWNVSRGSKGWDRVADGLAGQKADLIAVVEGGLQAAQGRESLFGRAIPGGDSRWFGGGMGLSVRGGRILDWTEHSLTESSRAIVARAEIRGRPIEVVLVDLDPNPYKSRGPAFEVLGRLLGTAPSGARLVVGDFNTPWESVHFDGFRATMNHAFDRAGQGLASTWPLPLPVLALDHVWGRGVRFSSCVHEDLGASDHRAVIFDFLID